MVVLLICEARCDTCAHKKKDKDRDKETKEVVLLVLHDAAAFQGGGRNARWKNIKETGGYIQTVGNR